MAFVLVIVFDPTLLGVLGPKWFLGFAPAWRWPSALAVRLLAGEALVALRSCPAPRPSRPAGLAAAAGQEPAARTRCSGAC